MEVCPAPGVRRMLRQYRSSTCILWTLSCPPDVPRSLSSTHARCCFRAVMMASSCIRAGVFARVSGFWCSLGSVFKDFNRNFQGLTSVLFCKLECCAVSCSPDLNIYPLLSTEYDSKCRNAPRFFPQNCSLLPDKATDGECLQPPRPVGKELLLALLAFRKPSINFLE